MVYLSDVETPIFFISFLLLQKWPKIINKGSNLSLFTKICVPWRYSNSKVGAPKIILQLFFIPLIQPLFLRQWPGFLPFFLVGVVCVRPSVNQQVWLLTEFFLCPFCKNSLICLEGKSMTPYWGNTILFRSSQQLPGLRLGPSKGFLSWHGALLGPSPCLVRCFRNYRDTRTVSGVAR